MRHFNILFVIFLLVYEVPSYAASSQVDLAKSDQIQLKLMIDHRNEKLNWTVRGNTIDILSELEWRSIRSKSLRIHGLFSIHPNVSLLGYIGVADIGAGTTQDSDFCFSNRQGEWSRSLSKARGDQFDVGFGLRLKLLNRTNFKLNASIGLSHHEQNYQVTNGRQVLSVDPASIPGCTEVAGFLPAPIGPIFGLNTTYDATWRGPWVGLDAKRSFGEWRFIADLNFHFASEYEGNAFWNLRPLWFTQTANGSGVELHLFSGIQVKKNVLAGVNLAYYRFETQRGDELLIAPGGCDNLGNTVCNFIGGFNGAEWDAWSVGFSAIVDF